MMTIPFHFMFHIKGSIYQGKTDFFTVTITQLLSSHQNEKKILHILTIFKILMYA